MRMGKVQFLIAYAVDFDKPDQIVVAKEFVTEDVEEAVRGYRTDDYIEVIEDSSLTESDIHSGIIDLTEVPEDEE